MSGSFVTCSCIGATGEFGGEFGNQLFQIAAVLGHAQRCGRQPLFFPWICGHSEREYSRLFPGLQQRTDLKPKNTWRQPRFAFDSIPDLPALDLLGSFQSERYFFEVRDQVRGLFAEPLAIARDVTAFLQERRLVDYSAMHLRYYDRESRDKTPLIHTLPEHYFVEAARHVGQDRPALLVTNNPTRAKIFAQKHLRGRDVIVASNREPLIDFYLLVRAGALVISNSSFSWWAAYLNTRVPVVHAPPRAKWFAFPNRLEPYWDTVDLYPANFVEIPF